MKRTFVFFLENDKNEGLSEKRKIRNVNKKF